LTAHGTEYFSSALFWRRSFGSYYHRNSVPGSFAHVRKRHRRTIFWLCKYHM